MIQFCCIPISNIGNDDTVLLCCRPNEKINFEEDSCARSPTSSVRSAEDESLLDDSYTREIMYNNYNGVIFETDRNQPSSCINPLISEISIPEIRQVKFQSSPVPEISSITALPLSKSPSIQLYPSPPRPSCSYVPTSPQKLPMDMQVQFALFVRKNAQVFTSALVVTIRSMWPFC